MAVKTFIGGTGNLTVDNAALPLAGTLSETMGGKSRTAKVGLSGKIGFVSKNTAGELDIEIFDDGTVDTAAIQGIENSTVLWEGDNGKTVSYTGVFQVGEPGANFAEGTMKFKLAYTKRNEIKATS